MAGQIIYPYTFGYEPFVSTWDPNNKGANVGLSGGNLIATKNTDDAFHNVRSLYQRTFGKWYWEFTLTNTTSNNSGFGFLLSDAGWTTTNSGLGTNRGRINSGGTPSGAGTVSVADTNTTTFADGDILGFAYNGLTGQVWMNKNGTYISSSGNPATNTNPTWTFSPSGQPVYPAIAIFNNGDIYAVNFGASAFSHQPSGYTGFNG